MSWIYTYTGQRVDLFEPRAEQINLIDIAQGLSQINRWGGQAAFPYSVAQHSVMVSQLCDPKDALYGLFHDAAEAYLGDVCRPLKRSEGMLVYREVYRQMERVILMKFCGGYHLPPSVLEADEKALLAETHVLMPRHALSNEDWLIDVDKDIDPRDLPTNIKEQPAAISKQGFLNRFYRAMAINPGVIHG